MRNDTAAKVAAWNKLGKLHNHLFPSLFEAAEKLVRDGVKVFKVDGTFTRAAMDVLPPLPPHCVYSNGRALLKVCHVVDGCGYYAERSVYLLGGIGLPPAYVHDRPEPMRTDWTEEEVQRLRYQADAAEKAHRDAVAKLGEFGRY